MLLSGISSGQSVVTQPAKPTRFIIWAWLAWALRSQVVLLFKSFALFTQRWFCLHLQWDFCSSISSFRALLAGNANPKVWQNIFHFPDFSTPKFFLFFIPVKKYFIESLIFSETCTSDCPQFLEDRQKLGELRLIQNGIVRVLVEVNWIILDSEGNYVG